eukprot:1193890-Prorocentrum_minimum.AAC.1
MDDMECVGTFTPLCVVSGGVYFVREASPCILIAGTIIGLLELSTSDQASQVRSFRMAGT